MPPVTAAYTPAWRVVRGALVLASWASLPAILALVLFATDPPVTPPLLLRLFAVMTLAPAAGAWAIGRAFAAIVAVEGGDVVVCRRGARLVVPRRSITDVRPWTVPLPAPGLTVHLASGRRLRWRLETRDPLDLLAVLAVESGATAAGGRRLHPIAVWAHARGRGPTVAGALGKFAAFALPPAAVFWNLHQHIAYGGTLGQYYLEGAGPWLTTFATYWATVIVYLVLYAGVWRGVGELIALVAAAVAPARAAPVRQVIEVLLGVAYYAGVPALVALRLSS